MCRFIQPHAGALIIPSVVFCQKCPNNRMFPATSHDGTQRFIKSWYSRSLPGPFAISGLNQSWHYQL